MDQLIDTAKSIVAAVIGGVLGSIVGAILVYYMFITFIRII